MIPLTMVTGNPKKVAEASRFFPGLRHVALDLPELQHESYEPILLAKLEAARPHVEGMFFVEDVGFELSCMHGFPGPLIKWMLSKVGPEGIWRIAHAMGDTRARAVCAIGLWDGEQAKVFLGSVDGQVISPRDGRPFGFDFIFVPDGDDRTFSEMSLEEKELVSHRGNALRAMRDYLEQKS